MSRIATARDASSWIASRIPVVCIVDDDEVYRQYLAVLLKNNHCRILEASNGQELVDILDRDKVDCILLDYNLIAENGISVYGRLKDRFLDVPPIVMLTGEGNERTIIKAFRNGVSDYVLKHGLRPEELFVAIADALSRREAQAENQEELSRLRGKSDFDDATGLFTREHMDERLARLGKSRDSGAYAVLLIAPADLEDTENKFGQVAADRVFRAFAIQLKANVRAEDACGRYDGATFIYLIDVGARQKTVNAICSHLAQKLSLDLNLNGLTLRVAPTIGVAFGGSDGKSVPEVLQAAEQAFDQCRGSGLIAAGADGSSADSVDGERRDEPTGTTERRAVRRQRVLRRGQLFLPNVLSAIECTIKNISSKGARLRVNGQVVLTDEFELAIGIGAERKQVVRRWQVGDELGVEFVQPDPQYDA